MAKRNTGGRARSRKRRPAKTPAVRVGPATEQPTESAQADGRSTSAPVRAKRARPRGAAERAARGGEFKDPMSVGERPQAPWHPLPLSELLILIGAIGVAVGLGTKATSTFLVGFAAVLLGTAEVTWREHRVGYRSHTLLLALAPTIFFHSVVILGLAFFIKVPRVLNLALLPVDGALFALLFKLLRLRFQDARRERRFAGAR